VHTINKLLDLPFVLTVATKDFHPPDHISFAPNHPPPLNKPFVDEITIANPYNAAETQTTRLWPVHCVQGTSGSSLIPELAVLKVQHVVEKGQDPRVEMYSAFKAPFREPPVTESGLAGLLREAGVSHVFVVGLAADYCVKCTAIDAKEEGFETVIVDEGTKPVDASEEGWGKARRELEAKGVRVVGVGGEEVGRVRSLR